MILIALFLVLVFLALAGLHVYWACGGLWPGKDPQSFLEYVVGASPSGRMPGAVACLVVAVVLSIAALLPMALLDWVSIPFSRLAGYLCATVFLLRGVYGYADHLVRPATRGTSFFRLNRVLYSPLCLLLGGLMLYLSMLA